MRILTSTLLLLFAIIPGIGHEMHHIIRPGAIAIEFSSDHGHPLAGEEVHVSGPLAGADQHTFSGTTDEKGRFFFLPTASGSWTAKVITDHGHGETVTFQVDEIGQLIHEEHHGLHWEDILSGLGFLLLPFSLWVLLKRPEKHAHS